MKGGKEKALLVLVVVYCSWKKASRGKWKRRGDWLPPMQQPKKSAFPHSPLSLCVCEYMDTEPMKKREESRC